MVPVGADGSLSSDSCYAGRMPVTEEMGHKETFPTLAVNSGRGSRGLRARSSHRRHVLASEVLSLQSWHMRSGGVTGIAGDWRSWEGYWEKWSCSIGPWSNIRRLLARLPPAAQSGCKSPWLFGFAFPATFRRRDAIFAVEICEIGG